MIQNAFRSNFVLFRLPLTQMILGGKGSGVTEILIAVVVPFFNVLAVFILQYYNESKMNFKESYHRHAHKSFDRFFLDSASL